MFVLFKQKTAYEMLISDWMSDVCSSDLTQLTFLPVAGGGSLQTGLTDAHTTFKKLTWRIALDQQLAPGILAYASYNRGFKSGLYNSIPPSADVIQPEVLDAYEAGLKTDLPDRRVRLNVAGFDRKSPRLNSSH